MIDSASMPCPVDWDDLAVPHEARDAWSRACGTFVYLNAKRLWSNPKVDWRCLLADRYDACYSLFNSGITSPIEAAMAGYLVWLEADRLILPAAGCSPWFDEGYPFDPDQRAFGVESQVSVGSYRADFMILVRGPKGAKKIAVECDGHDFHEKTKEQAAKDKKRDRDFLLSGVHVMRFTGSEIWKDGLLCFVDVQKAVHQAAGEVGFRHA